jgi:N4-(beta-N-acetylglucosaminyl)-L-asparaginase
MKNTRRNFVKISALSTGVILSGISCNQVPDKEIKSTINIIKKPIVISTWNHGLVANEISWKILEDGGSALDAVELGVKKIESDPNGHSVGIGGAPDRDGFVTLDACIMNHKNQCGAVAYIQNIENPISVARLVMEKTPHTMLAGDGAYQFAIQNGFPHTELLTEESKLNYLKWLEESKYNPEVNVENHDTISSLALDKEGNLSGACTTSGMAYKMHGRVGDSPIIGAGLFVDNEVGAACATGMGEAIVRIAGSAIIVEMMRFGKSPQEACELAIQRIMEKHDDLTNLQVGFLALGKDGSYGACAIYKGFNFAIRSAEKNELIDSKSLKV